MSTDYFYVQLRRSVRVAVPLAQTAEVAMLSQTQVCPIPGVASALLGVVNQRGKLLWVLELSDLLGLPPVQGRSPASEKLTLLILSLAATHPNASRKQMGCVISAMKGILSLDPATFEPVPDYLPAAAQTLLKGRVTVQGMAIAILNVDALLSNLQTVDVSSSLVIP